MPSPAPQPQFFVISRRPATLAVGRDKNKNEKILPDKIYLDFSNSFVYLIYWRISLINQHVIHTNLKSVTNGLCLAFERGEDLTHETLLRSICCY